MSTTSPTIVFFSYLIRNLIYSNQEDIWTSSFIVAGGSGLFPKVICLWLQLQSPFDNPIL